MEKKILGGLQLPMELWEAAKIRSVKERITLTALVIKALKKYLEDMP